MLSVSNELEIKKESGCYIRKMTLEDLSEVMRIERSAYEFPWASSMFESSLSSNDECCLLYSSDSVVGYAIVSYVLDEAHLLNICVSPEYGRLGYGRMLLKALIKKVSTKGSLWFFLEVRASNLHAINLYFSEGFNEVGVRPNYYPAKKKREDAILMTLDLSVDVMA